LHAARFELRDLRSPRIINQHGSPCCSPHDSFALVTDERARGTKTDNHAFFVRITKGDPMISQTLVVRIAVFVGVHVGMLVWLFAFL
jgi:hypothetical protein